MPATIRWDRLSRYGLLAVLACMLLLYVNPLRSYVSTWQESHRRAADVTALERESQQLRAKQRALKSPGVVESEARRLGLVKPGERPFVVTGLPRGK
jgi:cell division protein FtsB